MAHRLCSLVLRPWSWVPQCFFFLFLVRFEPLRFGLTVLLFREKRRGKSVVLGLQVSFSVGKLAGEASAFCLGCHCDKM